MTDEARGAYSRSAVQTLHAAGYTYHGGELWKPPLGPNPSPLLDRIAELEAALIEIDNEMRGAHDGGSVLPVQAILRRVLKKG